MIRFIHTGDIHLGMVPDKGKPWSVARKEEIWETFRRLIDMVKEKQPELLLIAGDLFHRQPSEQELREVDYLFSTLEKTKVVIIAGNHDYIRPVGGYEGFAWSSNVIFIGKETVERVSVPELNLDLYGFSYHQRDVKERRLDGIAIQEPEKYNILVTHGGEPEHLPISFADLGKKGFDYIALGHIHHPMFRKDLNMAYCGSLEPLEVNDMGKRGYIEGTIDEDGVSFGLVPFSVRTYQELTLDITEMTALMEVGDALKKKIAECGDDNIYLLKVVGQIEPDLVLTEEFLSSYGNIASVTLQAQTRLDYQQLAEENKDNLLGLYIRTYWKPAMSPKEEKALFYGVRALMESQKN